MARPDPARDEIHIASLLVHVFPDRIAPVLGELARVDQAQVHAVSDDGKLVLTLETDSSGAMSDRIAEIQQLAGVVSAVLVYHCADSAEAMNKEFDDAQA